MTRMHRLPFPLDGPLARLARGYLRIAARKPEATFTTGDPLGSADASALYFLRSHEMITWSTAGFAITGAGLEAHAQFERTTG